MYFANGPRIHEFLREMNEEVLSKYDAVTVGELPHTPDPRKVLQYVGAGGKQLSMVFQFDIVDLGQGKEHKYHFEEWQLSEFKAIVAKWQQFIEGTDGWTTVFCENHGKPFPPPTAHRHHHNHNHQLTFFSINTKDQGRSISRYCSDAPGSRVPSAKLLALMLCSLTGTLFLYQGQEIGMINVPASWPISSYRDIESVNFYHTMAAQTDQDPAELAYIMRSLQILGRDNARLPMQWTGGRHAGFMDGDADAEPWMRVHDLYGEINVARQAEEGEGSVLGFWKRLIQFRKKHADVLVHGSFEGFGMGDERTFVFGKRAEAGKMAVMVLNFTGEEQEVELPDLPGYEGLKLEVGSYDDAAEAEKGAAPGRVRLRPWEGRLYLAGGGGLRN